MVSSHDTRAGADRPALACGSLPAPRWAGLLPLQNLSRLLSCTAFEKLLALEVPIAKKGGLGHRFN